MGWSVDLHADLTPSAERSIQEIETWLPSSQITFDHFAFRTYGSPGLGISSLAKWFTELGYQQRDSLDFEKKKLRAQWFSPPEQDLPRVFISELKVELMSETAQSIIKKYTLGFDETLGGFGAPTGLLGVAPWQTPTEDDYRTLAAESEYAAWVLVNGYNLNHTTVSIHRLFGLDRGIEDVNMQLKNRGFVLNSQGGEVKVSEDGLLLQSSTVADMRDFVFDGNASPVSVPGSYIEFAERKVLPAWRNLKVRFWAFFNTVYEYYCQEEGELHSTESHFRNNYMQPAEIEEQHRREGFETASADKIFESTSIAFKLKNKEAISTRTTTKQGEKND